jgi:indole-3-glycerol phosphate synthase
VILEDIVVSTRERLRDRMVALPLESLKAEAARMGSDTGFPFERAISAPGLSVICEVKRASPSRGTISRDFPYLEIAEEYEACGASAVSVVTEPRYFGGADVHLGRISSRIGIPVLRKDFTLDEYQIYEARALGASAVLLICSILEDCELESMIRTAHGLGMSALTEVRDERELERALDAGAAMVGVNNRDLRDFTVDIGNSLRLAPLIPEDVLFLSESGIRGPEDAALLRGCGADAVLVGEYLMTSEDRRGAVAGLAGRCR